MQNHIWVIQYWINEDWYFYDYALERSEARAISKATGFKTRIRKFIAA